MLKYENECVSCHTEMGCMGDICPNKNVPRRYCDTCECEDYAKYTIDGDDYCEEHAKEYIFAAFDDLCLMEKAELLDMEFAVIEE